MRRYTSLLATPAALAALMICSLAQAPNPFAAVSFSATEVVSGVSTRGGSGDMTMKVYKSGPKLRMDIGGVSSGGRSVPPGSYMVVNGESGETTTVIATPQGTMCMNMSMAQAPNPMASASDPSAKIERAAAGTETIDGHACNVEDVTVTPSKGRDAGKQVHMKMWEAQDLKGFPVRIVVKNDDGSSATINYKDVDLTAPADSLFAKPDNCMSMPMGRGRGF